MDTLFDRSRVTVDNYFFLHLLVQMDAKYDLTYLIKQLLANSVYFDTQNYLVYKPSL